jgi:hypothetical protein
MRQTLLTLAAATAAMFLAAPDMSAQQTTVSQLKAAYTPVGQLPAGTYGVTSASLPATLVLDLRAHFPKGQLLVQQGGAETKYMVEFYDAGQWDGTKKIDKMSLHFNQGEDHFVACTLARRDDNRFSGVCKDEAGLEGWLEVAGRKDASLEPGKWYGPKDEL